MLKLVDAPQTRRPALVCFSHLRWNFVYQRPQHLLSRAARHADVFFFEEPIFDADQPRLDIDDGGQGVTVAVPHLPAGQPPETAEAQQRALLDEFLTTLNAPQLLFWYYTPMSLGFSAHVEPNICIYDCMDELSAFRFASAQLLEREAALLARTDVVFTGGRSLYEAKQHRHANVHCFPSSIDKAHFGAARAFRREDEPDDQRGIPLRRAGYFGVIDERIDMELLREAAERAPDVQFVMIGPVVKIQMSDLVQAPNVHWLGPKPYSELPRYLAFWDCGIMPFALNESTRYISPTKTPEFLAGGLPVVSTDINDVRRPYGEAGLVAMAGDTAEFTDAIIRNIPMRGDEMRLKRVDRFLADKSWDQTFAQMLEVLARHGAELRAEPQAALAEGAERA